ncbi:MAG: ABC transporter permease [Culicoidibacterales bacterium]
MRQLGAFIKKEGLDVTRTGKLFLCVILFTLFGIMNPAIAKLTPWLMEQFATTLAESGVIIVETEVTAWTSWQQFYKNVPMALIIYSILFAGILTNEYQHGTLINMVTKGLKRWKIIVAKLIVLLGLWTGFYWLMFAITYGYNAYFWDNSLVSQPFAAGALVYSFGIFVLVLGMFFSTIFKTSTAVLAVSGISVALMYGISIVPTVSEWMPTYLLTAQNILVEAVEISTYQPVLILTLIATLLLIGGGIIIFNKKAL